MTVFISIAAVLTLLVLAWLLRPLLRPVPQGQGVSSERLNAAIYRDQLDALDADLARGAISQDDFNAARDELQLRLLDDTQDSGSATPTGASWLSAKRTAIVLVLLFPLAAGGLYAWLGTPAAIDPVLAKKAQEDQVLKMVETLAAKLKANPNNPKGWAMLGRSYKVMGRFDDAEAAFKNAGDLMNTEPDLIVEYADLLGARAGNSLEGRPLELLNKALKIDPNHPMGLMMLGMAAYNRGDFKGAVEPWERLLKGLEPGSPDAQQVEANIADARAKAGMPAGKAMPATGTDANAGKLAPVDAAAAAAAGGMTPEKINQMVERLAEKLKANPGDLEGWVRLGRAYKVQGKLEEADKAYAKASKLVDKDPDLLAQYADLLALRTKTLQGRPMELVNKALAINPKHPMALMLAGTAAYQTGDYAKAARHWEAVLAVLPPGSPDAQMVQQELADARAKGGLGLQLQSKP